MEEKIVKHSVFKRIWCLIKFYLYHRPRRKKLVDNTTKFFDVFGSFVNDEELANRDTKKIQLVCANCGSWHNIIQMNPNVDIYEKSRKYLEYDM